MSEFDIINKAEHYNSHPSGLECIDVIREMSFDVANAVKYLWRTELKNGRQDLEKSEYYLRDAVKWNQPVYIGNTPMSWNAKMATVIRHETDPLRQRFFKAIRQQRADWALDAVQEMLAP